MCEAYENIKKIGGSKAWKLKKIQGGISDHSKMIARFSKKYQSESIIEIVKNAKENLKSLESVLLQIEAE